jgi:LSD1 subclass zinc finger protein
MSREKALKGFQCPSCGAPLEVKDGAKTVKCVYCGTTIKIPKEPSPVVEAIPKPVIDRDAVVEQYAKEEREKTERTIVLTAILAGIILFIVGRALLMKPSSPPAPEVYITYVPPKSTSTPLPPYASRLLTFDTNVENASLFYARDIDIDADGNILVAASDVDSSAIYKFDPQGAFVSKEFETDFIIRSFSTGTDGILSMSFGFDVHLYSNGQEVRVLENQPANEVLTGQDGSLYVLGSDQTISRYDQDGVVNLQISKVFKTHLGVSEIASHLAVDKLGNMYLLGESSAVIFKFAPDGTLLDQFGGKYESGSGRRQPGTFGYPKSIAVDSYGRIFVSDWDIVMVFDANDQYLDYFKITEDMNVQDLAFDENDYLYILTDDYIVEKYEVPVP